jgi:uncharacterized protein YajQ (UPF0234 family)
LASTGAHRIVYDCAMPSFDIVSEVSPMEIDNAVNQAKKELANRFDFKGSNAEIMLEKNEIKLSKRCTKWSSPNWPSARSA